MPYEVPKALADQRPQDRSGRSCESLFRAGFDGDHQAWKDHDIYGCTEEATRRNCGSAPIRMTLDTRE